MSGVRVERPTERSIVTIAWSIGGRVHARSPAAGPLARKGGERNGPHRLLPQVDEHGAADGAVSATAA